MDFLKTEEVDSRQLKVEREEKNKKKKKKLIERRLAVEKVLMGNCSSIGPRPRSNCRCDALNFLAKTVKHSREFRNFDECFVGHKRGDVAEVAADHQ